MEASMFIHHIDRTDMERILEHEWVAIASDALFGSNPHPRLYGTYPHVLGRYVREENHLTLEEAVRKMTSLPARAMGLDRKGLIRPGMDADIVVFDSETVAGPATFESPAQFPRGIPHVLVGGEFVVRGFESTGVTPGTAVRA
jgi:N-acyl-D-amino-acid deacylase